MEKKHVIIRAKDAGVFFGILESKTNDEVVLKDCRRIFYWSGAASISQLALEGVKNSDNCQFTVTVPEITILGVIEIIPCSEQAIENIQNVKIWKL